MNQVKDQAKATRTEGDLVSALKDMQEEFLQIDELASTENNYAKELSDLLKHVMFVLKTSVPISSDVFAIPVKNAALTSEGDVLVIHSDGLISSRPLDDFDSETAVKIIADGLPKLRATAIGFRKKISARVVLLEEVIPELRRLVRTLREGKAEKSEGALEDIVKSAISSPRPSEVVEEIRKTAPEKSVTEAPVSEREATAAPSPPASTPATNPAQPREKVRLTWQSNE